jgi:hypothetical protein
MAEVPVKRTQWTRAGLLDAYATAWTIVVGGNAPRAALALLHAQATLECGHDGKSCWNANVGNLMSFASWTGDYHVLRGAPECFDAGKVPAGWTVQPSNIACGPGKVSAVPANGSRFRAYSSFVEGCADKLRVLDRQWPRAIVALGAATGAADAAAFVAGLLGPPRYFTASSTSYAQQVASLASSLLKVAVEADWPTRHDTDPAPAPEPQPILDRAPGIVVGEGEHSIDDMEDP